ncbi:cytochrome P450 [Lophiostoma macrostomum CBS 122681]|uniref:Cytochrome P450 n=1 Tax=Lophiostoma macrostomum CBS 122681 TaxID=1314788 RepID=A0A6A6SJ83_9PLEO|nr:cytochrome P450 [Lophiostoma macrostomum CBS 122681]
MGVTFFSSTLPMSIIVCHLLQDFYAHQEHLPALREEARHVLNDPSPDMSKLPLLESFLTESIRYHCFLSTVIHRVPLQPFTFSDGYTVPKGEIVEFFQHRTMNDAAIYSQPTKFDPERFLGSERLASDLSKDWPFWGNSKLNW